MKRILIIEDHDDTLSFYKTALETAFEDGAYHLTCAKTGAQGLAEFDKARLGESKFDLVVTDLEIDPEQTGISVIKAIQAVASDVPIVIATGNKQPHINLVAKQLNIDHVWYKPIDNFAQGVGDILGLKMKEVEFVEKSPSRFSWHSRIKKDTVLLLLVMALVANNIRTTLTSPQLYITQAELKEQVGQINRKLDGAVSTHALPQGSRVTAPDIAGQGKVMKSSGNVRVIFEFDKDNAEVAKSIAKERGAVWLQITREK